MKNCIFLKPIQFLVLIAFIIPVELFSQHQQEFEKYKQEREKAMAKYAKEQTDMLKSFEEMYRISFAKYASEMAKLYMDDLLKLEQMAHRFKLEKDFTNAKVVEEEIKQEVEIIEVIVKNNTAPVNNALKPINELIAVKEIQATVNLSKTKPEKKEEVFLEKIKEQVQKENPKKQELLLAKTEAAKASLETTKNNMPVLFPVTKKYPITSKFGPRKHPVYKKMKKHQGVDINCPSNSKVIAAADGKVIQVKHGTTGYGKMIIVQHENGYSTLYAHLNSTLVKIGTQVKQGDLIGMSGNTGTSTSAHLHYEVRYQHVPLDPEKFISQKL